MLCKKKPTALSNSQAISTFSSASCIVYNAGKRCCRVILAFYQKNVIKLTKLLIMLITNKNQYLRTL